MLLLGLSGSLRRASTNSALLRALSRLAPSGHSVSVFRRLGDLPLYNPDLEAGIPAVAGALRQAVASADALVIASPEYAHGVSGTIKNALDWLVSFEPFVHKPVAVLNAAPRAHHAEAALRETLRTMSAAIVEPACLTIPILGSGLDEDAMVGAPHIIAAAAALFAAMYAAAGPADGNQPRFPVG